MIAGRRGSAAAPARLRAWAALAAALGLEALGTVLIPGSTSLFAVRSLLVLASLLGVASIGQTLVILLGGIDLSIPFVIGFGNVVAAELFGAGLSIPLAIVVVLALAALLGAFNGALSAALRIHPLIVTLGSGTVVQAAVLLWTKGLPSGAVPPAVSAFVSIGGAIGPLPVPPLVPSFAVLATLASFGLSRTPFGRRLYALGSNPTAAPYALIDPTRTWCGAYAISAASAAATGILLLGFTGSAYGEVGQPYLFQTIAAVVVGGTTLVGGSGGVFGTVAGALLLTELNTLLIGLGLAPATVSACLGVVIVTLVSLYGREAHVKDMI